MDDFVRILFKKSRFGRIVAQSLIITVVFFATLDAYMEMIKSNFGLMTLSFLTFYLIFWTYYKSEVENGEK